MKELLLTSLDMIHICIFIYLSIGGYFIPKQYLPIFLLSLPYIIIDWNDRDKLCWMTKLRNMIHYEEIDPKPKEDIENNFVNGLLRKQGINIDQKLFDILLYMCFIASWGYAYYRLTKQYKINVFPNENVKIITGILVIGWVFFTYLIRM